MKKLIETLTSKAPLTPDVFPDRPAPRFETESDRERRKDAKKKSKPTATTAASTRLRDLLARSRIPLVRVVAIEKELQAESERLQFLVRSFLCAPYSLLVERERQREREKEREKSLQSATSRTFSTLTASSSEEMSGRALRSISLSGSHRSFSLELNHPEEDSQSIAVELTEYELFIDGALLYTLLDDLLSLPTRYSLAECELILTQVFTHSLRDEIKRCARVSWPTHTPSTHPFAASPTPPPRSTTRTRRNSFEFMCNDARSNDVTTAASSHNTLTQEVLSHMLPPTRTHVDIVRLYRVVVLLHHCLCGARPARHTLPLPLCVSVCGRGDVRERCVAMPVCGAAQLSVSLFLSRQDALWEALFASVRECCVAFAHTQREGEESAVLSPLWSESRVSHTQAHTQRERETHTHSLLFHALSLSQAHTLSDEETEREERCACVSSDDDLAHSDTHSECECECEGVMRERCETQPQSSVYVRMLTELCEGVVCWASVVRATHGLCESEAESELVWLSVRVQRLSETHHLPLCVSVTPHITTDTHTHAATHVHSRMRTQSEQDTDGADARTTMTSHAAPTQANTEMHCSPSHTSLPRTQVRNADAQLTDFHADKDRVDLMQFDTQPITSTHIPHTAQPLTLIPQRLPNDVIVSLFPHNAHTPPQSDVSVIDTHTTREGGVMDSRSSRKVSFSEPLSHTQTPIQPNTQSVSQPQSETQTHREPAVSADHNVEIRFFGSQRVVVRK